MEGKNTDPGIKIVLIIMTLLILVGLGLWGFTIREEYLLRNEDQMSIDNIISIQNNRVTPNSDIRSILERS